MKFKRLLITCVLSLFASTAMASTVLVPTGNSVSFISLLSPGYDLFIFDDADTGFAGDGLEVPFESYFEPSNVDISPIGSSANFLASNLLGEITLTSSPNFILAMCDSETSFCRGDDELLAEFYPDGSAAIGFDEGGVIVQGVAPVPVPAAVWLFGSGLLGLVAVARRRRTTA